MKKFTVLMAAAECRGVAKVGGLADVVFDLSAKLRAHGHHVLVVLPLYADLPLALSGTTECLFDFLVRFEGQPYPVRLHKATVDGLEVHLLEAALFAGDDGGVYVDSGKRGKGPFEDDARRFALFSAAVWELVKHHEPFSHTDIVHCHDWHTALVPLLIRLDGQDKKYKTVFTIHNLDYQGTRPLDEPYAPGASWRQWYPERWESLTQSPWFDLVKDPQAAHCFNPLRCGVRTADAVNTVSPTYAHEITQPDDARANFLGGRGLEADLAARKKEKRLAGILNGLDYEAFDPSRLVPPFDQDTPSLLAVRRKHREQLLTSLPATVEALKAKHGKRFGNSQRVEAHLKSFLKTVKKLPLTVCVTRAVSQKLGLFTEDLAPGRPLYQEFLDRGSALLVLGTGELEDKLEPLNDDPRSLFLQVFDGEFATKLYAAGELFLMPSDFEPCGISQLMALRYGCLPLVHDRGGLHDTVIGGQTGFVFQGATRSLAKEAFLKVTEEAVALMAGKGYESMVRRAMVERFEWTKSVTEYESLYLKVSKIG